MSHAKSLLAAIYIERDFFNGNEVRAQEAAATDAGDFADYEAAVEALDEIIDTFYRDNIRPRQAAFIMVDIASRALARLRGES